MTEPLFSREDILAIRLRFDSGEHPRSIRRDYPRASIISIARIGKRESFAEVGTADERKLVASRLRRAPTASPDESFLALQRRLNADRALPGGPKPSALDTPNAPSKTPLAADPEAEIAAAIARNAEAARPRADDLLAEMLARAKESTP